LGKRETTGETTPFRYALMPLRTHQTETVRIKRLQREELPIKVGGAAGTPLKRGKCGMKPLGYRGKVTRNGGKERT